MVYIQHIQRQYDLEMETFSVNDPIIFLDGRFWDPVELIVYPSGQFQNLFSLSITRSQITRKLSWAGHKWTKWSAVYFIWRALVLIARWMYYNWPGKYSGKKTEGTLPRFTSEMDVKVTPPEWGNLLRTKIICRN